jgi:predicted nucleic acid-binding protein
VLVYVRDNANAKKQARAAAWMDVLWRSRRGRLSSQVLSEFYVSVTQKLKPGLDREVARADAQALSEWQPVAIDRHVLEEAWSIQDRYGLSFWDALIVGAARASACGCVLTEDLQDGQVLSGVRVISPFLHEPDDLA